MDALFCREFQLLTTTSISRARAQRSLQLEINHILRPQRDREIGAPCRGLEVQSLALDKHIKPFVPRR